MEAKNQVSEVGAWKLNPWLNKLEKLSQKEKESKEKKSQQSPYTWKIIIRKTVWIYSSLFQRIGQKQMGGNFTDLNLNKEAFPDLKTIKE